MIICLATITFVINKLQLFIKKIVNNKLTTVYFNFTPTV